MRNRYFTFCCLTLICLMVVSMSFVNQAKAESAATVLSLDCSPTSIAPDGYTTVTATLTSNGNGLYHEVIDFYYKVGSGDWTYFFSDYTYSNGQAALGFQPSYHSVPTGSTVYFKAVFGGDYYYAASEAQASNGVTVCINPTVLSLDCSPTSIAPDGYTTVTATLTSNGNGLYHEVIDFYYKVGSGDWTYFFSDYTYSNGQAALGFQPSYHSVPTGSTVYFKAVFGGDYYYAASEAQASNGVTVNPVGFVAPEYPFGAIVALIACFVAFTVYTKQKTPPSAKSKQNY